MRSTTERHGRSVLIARGLAVVALTPLVPSLVTVHHDLLLATGNAGGAAFLVTAGSSFRQQALLITAVTVYLIYWLRVWPHRRDSRSAVALVAAMIALASAYQWVTGPSADIWLFAALMTGCALRPRWAVPAVTAIASVASVTALIPHKNGAIIGKGLVTTSGLPKPVPIPAGANSPHLPLPGLDLGLSTQFPMLVATALPLLIAGLGAVLVTFLVQTNRRLQAARADQARLAVEEERTRLARDLHDVLGHNLSLIAVRLQVAEHLIRDGDRSAADEVHEVRNLTLSSLRDIRDTVGGYRVPTVGAELAGAGFALAGAGIELDLADDRGDLPPDVDAACAWIIREATTNVLRHSAARSCSIRLTRTDDELRVRITDDGVGGAAAKPGGSGTGLRGLRERVSAFGGTLEAGPHSRGFAVNARIPLAPALEAEKSHASA